MIYNPQGLATAFKLERERRGDSQKDVAKMVGVRQATVNSFENKPETTKLNTVFKILSAYQIGLDAKCGEVKSVSEKDEENW